MEATNKEMRMKMGNQIRSVACLSPSPSNIFGRAGKRTSGRLETDMAWHYTSLSSNLPRCTYMKGLQNVFFSCRNISPSIISKRLCWLLYYCELINNMQNIINNNNEKCEIRIAIGQQYARAHRIFSFIYNADNGTRPRGAIPS